MCRLFGAVVNKPVDFRFSLDRFRELGRTQRDGWGIGWYRNDTPVVSKGPEAAPETTAYDAAKADAFSRVLVAHVRKATAGAPRSENSHPFSFRNWIFAHNGSVDRDALLAHLEEPYRSSLSGETDSEAYFLWILQSIEHEGSPIEGIASALDTVRDYEHTGLNFVLSDGEALYAYREGVDSRFDYTLYYLVRDPGERRPFVARSSETHALLESKGLNGEKAILVCSETLTDEDWRPLGHGELLVVTSELELTRMTLAEQRCAEASITRRERPSDA